MWRRYQGHVVTVIGGVRETPKTADQPGAVYVPVPRAEQERALAFLDEHVLQTPTWLLDPDLLRRIQPVGAVDRVRGLQVSVLGQMLDPMRLGRLVEAQAVDGDAYPLADYMDGLRGRVWSELDARRPTVDVFRRNLQRGYLEQLAEVMTEDERDLPEPVAFLGVDVSQSDVRAAARGALRRVQADARAALARTADAATRDHLADVVARVDETLDPGR